MSPANATDPRRRLQPEQRREELVRVGVELFAEGTLDRTHVNEIIKRAGGSRLDQDPEIAAAMATSFERYERLVLMLMGIPEPDARAMFAAQVWISTMIALCLAWLDHPEISQETITNISAQTLRSLVSQARQGAEHTSEPAAAPTTAHEPVSDR